MQSKARTALVPSADQQQSQIFHQFSPASSDGEPKESKGFIITSNPHTCWLNLRIYCSCKLGSWLLECITWIKLMCLKTFPISLLLPRRQLRWCKALETCPHGPLCHHLLKWHVRLNRGIAPACPFGGLEKCAEMLDIARMLQFLEFVVKSSLISTHWFCEMISLRSCTTWE